MPYLYILKMDESSGSKHVEDIKNKKIKIFV